MRVDYEPLPAIVDIEQSIDDGVAFVHDDLESIVAVYVIQEKGNYDSIRKQADVIIWRRY